MPACKTARKFPGLDTRPVCGEIPWQVMQKRQSSVSAFSGRPMIYDKHAWTPSLAPWRQKLSSCIPYKGPLVRGRNQKNKYNAGIRVWFLKENWSHGYALPRMRASGSMATAHILRYLDTSPRTLTSGLLSLSLCPLPLPLPLLLLSSSLRALLASCLMHRKGLSRTPSCAFQGKQVCSRLSHLVVRILNHIIRARCS